MVATHLRSVREGLVREFADLSERGVILEFQRQLARAIADAELGQQHSESKRHVHLLRAIGDGLAWSLLPAHTIRTLNRHPGPAPSLKGQADDLEFVFDVADHMTHSGYVPIIADLTNLLRVGDLIAASKAGVMILECKNSPMPTHPQAGRRARQRERGERRARYLRDSQIVEADGIRVVAVPAEVPEPDWVALKRAVDRAMTAENGAGIEQIGERDFIVVCRDTGDRAGTGAWLKELRSGMIKPTLGFHSEVIDDVYPLVCSPMAYPLDAETKVGILEGELLILRALDLSLFDGDEMIGGRSARLHVDQRTWNIEVRLGTREETLSDRFVSTALLSPTSAATMRAVALDVMEKLLSLDGWAPTDALPASVIAEGDRAIYGTVYRDEGNEPLVVLRAEDLRLGAHMKLGQLPFSPCPLS